MGFTSTGEFVGDAARSVRPQHASRHHRARTAFDAHAPNHHLGTFFHHPRAFSGDRRTTDSGGFRTKTRNSTRAQRGVL